MSGFAQLIDNYFHITEKGSTIRTEIRGGIITFLAMVYILAVNPIILTTGGLYNVDWNAVFLATALAAIISCLLMGLYAKFPVALAPGMGINAFISYTIASQLGGSYPICLAAVFVSGIIFLVISVTNIREKIIMSIPTGMRYAIAAGIGFFIALVGLTNAGIIVHSSSALQFSNALFTPPVLLGLFCIFVTIILWLKKWWGAVIGGMFITLVVGLVIGMFYSDPSGLIPVLPDSVITDFGNINYIGTFLDGFATIDWGTQLPVFLATVLALFIVDMFDTAGTLLAVANRANLIDERGEVENLKKAMIVDSVGTVVGAAVGTTTTTSYIESSTGVEAGARTGFMAVIVGLLFLVALFLSPIFGSTLR